MNIDYKLIGSRIKKERNKKGQTQETLAEALDVSIGYVSQVERGITKISLELLGSISVILECDIAQLITESEKNSAHYIESDIMKNISKLSARKRALLNEFIALLLES